MEVTLNSRLYFNSGPSKFNIIGSGSVTNRFIDPLTNTLITEKITRLALEPKKKGKSKWVGSGYGNNKIYKTEPFDIVIKDLDKNLLHIYVRMRYI
jgi:hypothetical protein